MKLLCESHPTYKAERQPRTDCTVCWVRWLRAQLYHPGQQIQRLEQIADERYFA